MIDLDFGKIKLIKMIFYIWFPRKKNMKKIKYN